MRVLVTGGRDFNSYDARMWLYEGLNLLHGMDPVTELIEGGAAGADTAAHNWALWRDACGDRIRLTTMPADWDTYGRGAGAIRNQEMAKLRPDVVLACPGGRGTAHMVSVALAADLRVIYLERMPVAKPKGTLTVERPDLITVDATGTYVVD